MKRNSTIVKEINKMFPPSSAKHPVCFIRDGEDQVIVSGECYAKIDMGDLGIFDVPVIDYYGEAHNNYPHIHCKLEEYAEKMGCYWEWENPACIVLVK